jgi:hypothetical protein
LWRSPGSRDRHASAPRFAQEHQCGSGGPHFGLDLDPSPRRVAANTSFFPTERRSPGS